MTSTTKQAFIAWMSGKPFTTAWRLWKRSKERHITEAQKDPLVQAFVKLAGVQDRKQLAAKRRHARRKARAA